jgi:hypothetical protein
MKMMKTLQQDKDDTEMSRILERWSVVQVLVLIRRRMTKATKMESKGCIWLPRWPAVCVF